MKKQAEPIVDEGWIVHVYGRNRRLLCALEPSHGWSFLLGCGFGLILAIALFNLFPPSSTEHQIHSTPTTETPLLGVD